jgi:hypothetical protein
LVGLGGAFWHENVAGVCVGAAIINFPEASINFLESVLRKKNPGVRFGITLRAGHNE